jgi:hypothetical protein
MEKRSPYGPYSERKERDEQVSTVVVPVQLMLFDMLLDYPNQKLFTYGTLVLRFINDDQVRLPPLGHCVGRLRCACGGP